MNIDLTLLLEKFSLLTVGEDKTPNFAWKELQTKKLTSTKFLEQYNYKGGITKKDGLEIPATKNVGIITGYEDLECIDVDLKVFSTAKEKTDFWEEFISYLNDNILDFYEKVVVYKTKNDGYHLLYKSKRCDTNKKIAVLQGHKEAVIESRGRFGYVFLYPDNNVSKKTYFDIDYISDADREIIWSFSRMYNYVAPIEEKPLKVKEFTSVGVTPWQDFNDKNSVLDIVQSEFEIIRHLTNKIIIKRHGATSPHSGYIFKNTDCMYLFSTGTIYPHEKLINAFQAYTIQKHNGDFSAAAKDIYSQGYGERLKKEFPKEDVIEQPKIETLEFPLEVFPPHLKMYLEHSNSKLMLNIDFMAGALLWMTSVIIGNSLKIKAKKGWTESAVVFISLVGKAGLGKTPSVNNIIAPIKKINKKRIEDYFLKYQKYEQYLEMTKKEQVNVVPIEKPKRKQLIASDTTIEALINLHNESKNAIGINKDELDGWFKDMNKYREGSDKQQWLSIWSNESIIVNRLSRNDLYINSPFISVIGGIQPEILDQQFTNENISSGFIDRFLFCYPQNLKAEKYSEEDLGDDLIEWYENTITSMNDTITSFIKKDDDNEIIPFVISMSEEARKEWVKIFDSYSEIQNSEDEPEMFKSMISKIKIYVPRFALILFFMDCFFYKKDMKKTLVSVDNITNANKLAKYFISQFKKIKVDSLNSREVSDVKNGKVKRTSYEALKEIIIKFGDSKINKTSLAKDFNVSRVTLNNWIEKIQNENNNK